MAKNCSVTNGQKENLPVFYMGGIFIVECGEMKTPKQCLW